jgi:hypothetical protein
MPFNKSMLKPMILMKMKVLTIHIRDLNMQTEKLRRVVAMRLSPTTRENLKRRSKLNKNT